MRAIAFWLAMGLATMGEPVLAQALPPADQFPLDVERLQADEMAQVQPCPAEMATSEPMVVTERTICQASLTPPSLWWAEKQFSNKLVSDWLAYPEGMAGVAPWIDIAVNRQLWSLYDYLERYEFVNHFGAVARDFGYNIRVFDPINPDAVVASYTCDFQAAPARCGVFIDGLLRDAVRGGGGNGFQP